MSKVAVWSVLAETLFVVFAQSCSVVVDWDSLVELWNVLWQWIGGSSELFLTMSEVASLSKGAVAILVVTTEGGLILIDLHHLLGKHLLRLIHFSCFIRGWYLFLEFKKK